MRFDRLLTLTLFDRLPRVGALGPARAVPILMYHSITEEQEPAASPYYRTCTPPAIFKQHIELTAAKGYRSISLSQALELLSRTESLDGKYVVITFDDGFRNFYTEAWPVLRNYGMTATMFLPTAYIRTSRSSFKNQECMTWSEVCELRECGVEFGSHTVNHPKLVELSWAEIERELRDSKAEIEQRLQEPVTTFAHPYAFPQTEPGYVQRFRPLLVECGYTGAVTTEIGRAKPGDDPLLLRRLPVNSCDDRDLFRAKLEGAYDWMSSVQTNVKKIKTLGRKFRKGERRSQPGLTPTTH